MSIHPLNVACLVDRHNVGHYRLNNVKIEDRNNLEEIAKASYHLQECQVSRTNVIKIDLDILPSDFRMVWIN